MHTTLRLALFSLLALLLPPLHAEEPAIDEEQRAYLEWASQLWQSLDRQQGDIALPNGVATLHVPEQFYYLPPADAQKVLVELWGNPPGAEPLGMIFPAGATPFDADVWGATLDYEEEGYVSDEDAASIDYNELLEQMREDTAAASEQRVAAGYEPIQLIGWAAHPYYDSASKKLYWAKEIAFDGEPEHTLNYNIRVLGRQGVLVMNFIADMEQLDDINRQLQPVLAMAEFDQGHRYQDFDPDVDKVAAYGIGALVAGKVAAKTGLIAAGLLLLKKFWVVILVALGWFGKRLFGRGKEHG